MMMVLSHNTTHIIRVLVLVAVGTLTIDIYCCTTKQASRLILDLDQVSHPDLRHVIHDVLVVVAMASLAVRDGTTQWDAHTIGHH